MFLLIKVELLLFFFVSSRRRHTRFSRDWSSDVCSSDLIKGSVSNLNNLGAQLGVIVIGTDNIGPMRKQLQYKDKSTKELESRLRKKVSQWVHAEARPQGRIAVMLESEVEPWTRALVANVPSELTANRAFDRTPVSVAAPRG